MAVTAASSGDEGRGIGVEGRRLRERGGAGFGRWPTAGLYDVGRRICRARLQYEEEEGTISTFDAYQLNFFFSLTRQHGGLPLSDIPATISRERALWDDMSY